MLGLSLRCRNIYISKSRDLFASRQSLEFLKIFLGIQGYGYCISVINRFSFVRSYFFVQGGVMSTKNILKLLDKSSIFNAFDSITLSKIGLQLRILLQNTLAWKRKQKRDQMFMPTKISSIKHFNMLLLEKISTLFLKCQKCQ